jgi:hypothetical protein
VKGPHRLPSLLPADREKGEEEFRRIEHELRLALAEIRFGSIEIVIQDSRVVQLERREKVRFDREGREGR